jgi:hypothetical protein
LLDLLDGRFKFPEFGAASGYAVKRYPLVEDILRAVLRDAIPALGTSLRSFR